MLILKIALVRLLDVITWMIIIKALMSWFPGAMDSKIYQIISELTDPIEAPVRKAMSKFTGGPVDFSPMISIIILMVISRLIMRLL